jgi:hypothetical protein
VAVAAGTCQCAPCGKQKARRSGGPIQPGSVRGLDYESAASRVGRWLANQARTTASTSAERRVFSQSLSRISSQDGPDTIGDAATARLSSSRSAGNSYSIDAPYSASDIFRRPFKTGYLAPNIGRTRLSIQRLVSRNAGSVQTNQPETRSMWIIAVERDRAAAHTWQS